MLYILTSYAGTAWVYIGFGDKQPDWLSVVIPLDGDVRSVYTVGYQAVITGAEIVTHELIPGQQQGTLTQWVSMCNRDMYNWRRMTT